MKAAIKKALKRLITCPFAGWAVCLIFGIYYFINSDGQYLIGFLNWTREVPGGMEGYFALCCLGCGFVGGLFTFVEIFVEFIFDIFRKSPDKSGDK